jgi:4-diphosphocytidyl-2-C-methyl-D-erythritol kinase
LSTRRFRSFAKINLGLEVTGRLPNGYHELKTLFATISVHDLIDITETKGTISVLSDHPSVPRDETNLAQRAAVALRRLSGRKSGVAIFIHKRIAVGGGLGGGSSNAATVLRALDRMWSLGLGPAGLREIAGSLGADVPYFLVGGPALGLGRGDVVRPVDLRLRQKVLLVPGQGGVSTAQVFGRFANDTQPKKAKSRVDSLLRSAEAGGALRLDRLRNDLDRAAIAESPALARTARRVGQVGRTAGALQAAMSGSGSSFFLLFDRIASRARAAELFREDGIRSLPCSFVSRRSYESRFEIVRPG